jgi:predicted nuclease of predicted toxin-antitoxin system
MTYAATKDYVVLTHDLDFSAILAVPTDKSPASYNFARKI